MIFCQSVLVGLWGIAMQAHMGTGGGNGGLPPPRRVNFRIPPPGDLLITDPPQLLQVYHKNCQKYPHFSTFFNQIYKKILKMF